MRRKLLGALVVVAFVVGSMGYVWAQASDPQVQYKKETSYDFDDDVVEGELQRPEGELVGMRRKARHSSLIKVRLHFVPELIKSAENS